MDIREITEREKIFANLWARMDKDESLIKNYQYYLQDFASEGAKPIAKTYSVAVPLAGTHHSKYKSKLMKLKKEYGVLTDDDEVMKDVISFLEDSDAAANCYNAKRLELDPDLAHIDHVCKRGWVAERNLWRLEDGELITDTASIDPRYLVWWAGQFDLEKASLLTYRHANEINEKYDTDYTETDLIEVRDCWDKKKEYVYIKNDMVFEQDNPYGFVPFVIKSTPWGPIIGSEAALEHRGESIFYPHREMYDDVSFNASISKTMAREGLRPPLQTAGKGPNEYPGGGDIVETGGVENELKVVPRADMTGAQQTYMGLVSATLQQNSFGITTYGSTTAPMSGNALESLQDGSEEILESRINCLGPFFAECAMMRLKQYVMLGEVFKVKQKKHKPQDLEGEFDIECHLLDTSIDTYARRGQAAGGLMGIMPAKWIRRQIVGEQNPEEVDNEVERETAERQDPAQAMYEMIMSLIDKEDDMSAMKAQMMLFDLETVLKQRKGAGVADPMNNPQSAPRPMPVNPAKPQPVGRPL